jgi:hypothetical protein
MLPAERAQRIIAFKGDTGQGRRELLGPTAELGGGELGPIDLQKTGFRRPVKGPE